MFHEAVYTWRMRRDPSWDQTEWWILLGFDFRWVSISAGVMDRSTESFILIVFPLMCVYKKAWENMILPCSWVEDRICLLHR